MKTAKILACCLILIPLGGSVQRAARKTGVERSAQARAISASLQQGEQLLRRGRYVEAAAVFHAVEEDARSQGLASASIRALGNLGVCELLLHRFQTALQMLIEARRRAELAGDTSRAALIETNIASVYVQIGEYNAAADWVERSIANLSHHDRASQLARLQLQLAALRGLQGRMAEALKLFREGLDGADRMGDTELYAIGWNRLGEVFLQRGDLEHAEPALLEAYRVRKLQHLVLDSSYRNLGRLRLAQGDLSSASTLLDRAVELAGKPSGLAPSWLVYESRGTVRLAQGRLREALDDLRIARRLAQAWRGSAPTDDTSRMGAEGLLDQMYAALVEAGNRLYLETRDPRLAEETFAAEEENRAASLRAWLRGPHAADAELPLEYWQAVGRLQRAEAAAIRHPGTSGVDAARAELIGMEAALGPSGRPAPPDVVEASRKALGADTALLTFQLGDKVSWLWAVDREGLAAYALAPRGSLAGLARAVGTAIREDAPEAEARAAELYQALFGPLDRRFRQKPRWLLALDDALFTVPMAALVTQRQPRPAYLAAQHTLETIPGAAYWLASAAGEERRLTPLFVGVADPIYNQADARLAPAARHKAGSLALARLVGSGSEIEASARAWGGPSVLLQGGGASREGLEEQLRRRPAAVHLATHYLESAARPGYALIALSLGSRGEPELLTPFEIARWRVTAGLVVLSGCHSAAGEPLPATGLQGLTRAWLAAGARSVVSSLWETPDDDGGLFGRLYRNLRAGDSFDAAGALREAQLELIRAGGVQAQPRYWAAFFIVGTPGRTVLESWN